MSQHVNTPAAPPQQSVTGERPTSRDLWSILGVLPDRLVSLVMPYLHRLSPPHPNTWHDASQYYGLTRQELFVAPAPPVEVARKPYGIWGTNILESISFPSQHEAICPKYRRRAAYEYPANATVISRCVRPMFRRRSRALIYIHGWMEPGGVVESFTILPVMSHGLGVDIFQMDLPFHGARKEVGDILHGEYFWSADLVRTLEAVRQSVTDVRSLVRYLRGVGYEEVGLLGVSLGGVVSILTACAETDLDYVMPMVAHVDLSSAVQNSPILVGMKEDLERYGISMPEFNRAIERVGLQRFEPVIDKDRILIIAARDDMLLDPDRTEYLWRSWDCPPIYWFPGGHLAMIPQCVSIFNRISEHIEWTRTLQPRASRAS